jgi:hypothetical protein
VRPENTDQAALLGHRHRDVEEAQGLFSRSTEKIGEQYSFVHIGREGTSPGPRNYGRLETFTSSSRPPVAANTLIRKPDPRVGPVCPANLLEALAVNRGASQGQEVGLADLDPHRGAA